jgi:class 3 adenylate cyclase
MERRLTAILSADVVGYSASWEMMSGTLEGLKAYRRELIDPAIKEFRGRIIKLMGDGELVEFASVVDAVQCAAVIQRQMATRDTAYPRTSEFSCALALISATSLSKGMTSTATAST